MKLGRKSGLQGEAGPSGLEPTRESGGKLGMSARQVPREKRGYLDGQMLIAMPTMGDERFSAADLYVRASSEGAMGIVVNQPAPHISFPDLLVQLEVVGATELIQLPPSAGGVKVLKGGPVETSRGFVLHSSDFFIENSTLPIDEGICLTATPTSSRRSRAATVRKRRACAWLRGLGTGPARD